MQPTDLRQRFLRFLHYKVFRRKEGEIMHPIGKAIWKLFYPLHAMYVRNSQCHYDLRTDVYTIRGMKFSGNIFSFLNNEANEGRVFRLKKTSKDGTVEVEYLPDYDRKKLIERTEKQPAN